MKYIFIFFALLATVPAFAQIMVAEASAIQATEEYNNIHTVPIYSDENSSSFIIFVKKDVRKHYHLHHTEVVIVLEGTGDFYLAGERMTIKKGDHIVIPPGVPHSVTTTSGKPLKVISIQSPEFIGKDRVFVEEDDEEKNEDGNKKTSTSNNDEDDEDEIPEYDD